MLPLIVTVEFVLVTVNVRFPPELVTPPLRVKLFEPPRTVVPRRTTGFATLLSVVSAVSEPPLRASVPELRLVLLPRANPPAVNVVEPL